MDFLWNEDDWITKFHATGRGKVSSDSAILDDLSVSFPWLPNSQTCRPSEIIAQEKAAIRTEIVAEWRTTIDYIAHIVFGREITLDKNGKKMTDCKIDGRVKFVPSTFPYQIPEGSHYVLWYGSPVAIPDAVVDRDINGFLSSMAAEDSTYQYGWYVNPKMTVPDIFHVQVFWTTRKQIPCCNESSS